MTATFVANNGDLGNTTIRLGGIAGLTQIANKGEVAFSTIPVDDSAFALNIQAFRNFYMNENTATPSRVYSGFIQDRDYERADSLLVGGQRRITVSIMDLNSMLGFAIISHSTFHYNRPAETDITRLNWLLAQVIPNVRDNGLIDTANPVTMTATDYTGQFAIDVMKDMAARSGKNFFVYADPTTNQSSLAYFKSTNTSLFNSTLSISNVLSDLSSTCLAPFNTKLNSDPSLVYDGVFMPYTGGSVYVKVAGRVLSRDVAAPQANTSSRVKALELANKMLENSENEYQTVTCTIRIPAAQVNLLAAGMRVNARFTHFQSWETGQYVRVLERTVAQDELSDDFYNVTVKIGHPVEVNFITGASPDNTRVWPSQQPPFQTGAGAAFTYVQSAKTADNSDTSPTATYAVAPTTGNLLIATLLAQQAGSGSPAPSDFTATFPTGWNLATGPVGTSANGRLNAMWVAYKFATAGEPSTVAPTISLSGVSPQNGFIDLAEYSGPTAIEIAASSNGALSGPLATATIPSVTPLAGLPTLLIALVGNDPGYSTTYSAGWTVRQQSLHAGPRQNVALVDQIIASASGSYTGTATGNVGDPSEYWYIPVVAFASSGGEPAIGQSVVPETATADGVRVIYTTNYPYQPGSLVVKVNGNILAGVTETSPTTGVFTLPAAPASGSIITWTYSVADPAPTGANNPAPASNPPSVPPGPGSMPGGDGTSRPPDQEYSPAETPNDVITVFTIVPYIAGQAFVYINGLIQRKGTDWNELSPSAGTIEFTTAPWTGASITVKAMPVTAPPTGSGFSNPSLYGSGLNADTKANIQMGPEGQVGLRFKAGASSALNSIRIQARGGPVYSGGTGGSYTVTVKAVDASGNPTGAALATQTYTPGNPGGSWTSYDLITWSSPATLVSGTKYVVGFLNADGSPLVNYVSINCLYIFGGTLTPRQPKYTDADFAVLVNVSSWLTRTQYTSNIDLTYASGYHDGQGYVQLFTAQYGTITGTTTMVRENFTVSGGARTVVSAAVRVRRSSGTDPLILGLYTGAGVLIEAISIPAATVPISAAGSDNGGSVWVGGRFLTPHILANATNYYLRLSCASSSTYTAAPIRKGNDNGFSSTLVFSDGTGQFTTNSGASWTDLYTFDSVGPDLQFYFGVST